MSLKTERKKNIFPHARIKELMKEFGVEGFSSGVIELAEKSLYEFLKEVTEYATSFTKHDSRKRITSYDLKQSLRYLYNKLYEKIGN